MRCRAAATIRGRFLSGVPRQMYTPFGFQIFTTNPVMLRGELIECICQENNKDVEHLVGKE